MTGKNDSPAPDNIHRHARAARLLEMMNRRASLRPDSRAYPIDEWKIIETRRPRALGQTESVFAVANGFLGLRGTPDEGTPAQIPAVLLNGFYESWPIVYTEDAYGFARTGQTIVPVTDGSLIRLYVDDEPFDLETDRILSYERVLDMHNAELTRTISWETQRGQRVDMRSRRLTSLVNRHLAIIEYEVSVDTPVHLAISSELVTPRPRPIATEDPRSHKGFAEDVMSPAGESVDGLRVAVSLRTHHSGLELGAGMDHEIHTDCTYAVTSGVSDGRDGRVVFLVDAERDQAIRIVKYVAYHYAESPPEGSVRRRVGRTLDRARSDGYNSLVATHRGAADAFWDRADVVIDGAPEIQQAVRFNLFHLLQGTARAEGHGIAAKGVTGLGYEGHYFWDMEVFVLPFLVHTQPQLAKQLLQFRSSLLDAARRRANELGHRGALFPWRTISGDEASAYFAASTAQYHIDADIVYGLMMYVRLTGDDDFLLHEGASLLVETARLWADLGFFSDRHQGQFCINGVTGPDEYSALVDNNTFTNMMAKENLEAAVATLEWMRAEHPQRYEAIVALCGLESDELDMWRRAAATMYIPFDSRDGVHMQDDSFRDLEMWDFDGTPLEKYPLLLHFHPLEIYRRQVIKQADVVLATFLLDQEFTPIEKRRIFDYYDPLTTGDSSLSACVQSAMAAEIGYEDAAFEYFLFAAAIDLADLAGNTADGIHVASCGGTWMSLVNGFGGLRDYDGTVRFHPKLPASWNGLSFKIDVHGMRLEVDIAHDATTYLLVAADEAETLTIFHEGGPVRLTPGVPASMPTARPSVGLPTADQTA